MKVAMMMQVRRLVVLACVLTMGWAQAAVLEYGPIKPNTTLYQLARVMKSHYPDASMSQVALAIYQYNPQAFEEGNINRLVKNTTLQYPPQAWVDSVDPRLANQQLTLLVKVKGMAASTPPPKPVKMAQVVEDAMLDVDGLDTVVRPHNAEVVDTGSSDMRQWDASSEDLMSVDLQEVEVTPMPWNQVEAAELDSAVAADPTVQMMQTMQAQLVALNQQVVNLQQQVVDAQSREARQALEESRQERLDSLDVDNTWPILESVKDILGAPEAYTALSGLLLLILAFVGWAWLKYTTVTHAKLRAEASTEPEPEVEDDDNDYDLFNAPEGVPAKLDLARAYISMGDSGMAMTLLNEVVEQGNPDEKAEAMTLMAQLQSMGND